MKTPHAILIGLSLIAVVIFFKGTMTPPAHAFVGGPDGFACTDTWCYIFKGDRAVKFAPLMGANKPFRTFNWRTGKDIE